MPDAKAPIPQCAILSAPVVFLVTLLFFGPAANAADDSQLKDFDTHSAEARFARSHHFSDLHQVPAGPDGVKSQSFELEEYQAKIGGPAQPPFATMTVLQAFFEYCAFPNIVLAKNIDSRSVLSSARDDIFTISHFTVLNSLRGDLKPGDIVVSYRIGGEVVDAGEKLRIDTPRAPAYSPGADYLLRLYPDASTAVKQFAVPLNGTLLVKKGRVYPEKMLSDEGTWAGFLPGTEFSKVEATLRRVATLKTCP